MKLLEMFKTKEMFKKYCEVVVEGAENCTGDYWINKKYELKRMIAEIMKEEEGYEISIAIYNVVNGSEVKIKNTEEDLDYDLEGLSPTEIISNYSHLDLDCEYYLYNGKYEYGEIEMLTPCDLSSMFDYEELAGLTIDNVSGRVNSYTNDIDEILDALF